MLQGFESLTLRVTAEHGEAGEPQYSRNAPAKESSRILEPAKVMRIAAVLRRTLEETRGVELDEAAGVRLAAAFQTIIDELAAALSSDLASELQRLAPGLNEPSTAAQARIALAQVAGWLEGLLQAVSGALLAQQVAAQPTEARPPIAPAGGPPGLLLVATGQTTPNQGPLSEHRDDGGNSPGQYL